MKRSLKLICLLLLANFFTNGLKAQSLKDSIPVMIAVGTPEGKAISDTKAALKSLSNVSYISFCTNHNVFLLYIGKTHYGSTNNFLSALKTTSGVNTLIVKNGKMHEIMKACSCSDASEASFVKARYGK